MWVASGADDQVCERARGPYRLAASQGVAMAIIPCRQPDEIRRLGLVLVDMQFCTSEFSDQYARAREAKAPLPAFFHSVLGQDNCCPLAHSHTGDFPV